MIFCKKSSLPTSFLVYVQRVNQSVRILSEVWSSSDGGSSDESEGDNDNDIVQQLRDKFQECPIYIRIFKTKNMILIGCVWLGYLKVKKKADISACGLHVIFFLAGSWYLS